MCPRAAESEVSLWPERFEKSGHDRKGRAKKSSVLDAVVVPLSKALMLQEVLSLYAN